MYLILIVTIIFNKFIYNIPATKSFIVIIILVLSFLFGLIWKIKLKNFNWNINFSMLVWLMVVFACWFIPQNLIADSWNLTSLKFIYNMKLITLIENFLKKAFYPAFYEELLFRGVLISGLLYFKIDHWEINIVQALILGITHFSANTQIGSNYIMVLSLCSSQFLSGYFWVSDLE